MQQKIKNLGARIGIIKTCAVIRYDFIYSGHYNEKYFLESKMIDYDSWDLFETKALNILNTSEILGVEYDRGSGASGLHVISFYCAPNINPEPFFEKLWEVFKEVVRFGDELIKVRSTTKF